MIRFHVHKACLRIPGKTITDFRKEFYTNPKTNVSWISSRVILRILKRISPGIPGGAVSESRTAFFPSFWKYLIQIQRELLSEFWKEFIQSFGSYARPNFGIISFQIPERILSEFDEEFSSHFEWNSLWFQNELDLNCEMNFLRAQGLLKWIVSKSWGNLFLFFENLWFILSKFLEKTSFKFS